MLPKSVNSQGLSRGKTKQGDWICLKCSNYNYSFRNRCTAISIQVTGVSCRTKEPINTNWVSSEPWITDSSAFPVYCFYRLIEMVDKPLIIKLKHSSVKAISIRRIYQWLKIGKSLVNRAGNLLNVWKRHVRPTTQSVRSSWQSVANNPRRRVRRSRVTWVGSADWLLDWVFILIECKLPSCWIKYYCSLQFIIN